MIFILHPQEIFNETKVSIAGLNPVTTYRFQVFAENGVSDQTDNSEYIDITVTTEASVPSTGVSRVYVKNVKSTEVSLRWTAPKDPYSDIETYEVRYFTRGRESNATSILVNGQETTIKGL